MSLLAAGLGLGGALLDYKSGKDAAAFNESLFKQALAAQQRATRRQQTMDSMARIESMKGLDAIQTGYGDARKRVAGQAGEAHRAVADLGRASQGQAARSTAARGLSNTTAATNAQTGANYATARAHGSVADRLNGLMANLDSAEAGAVARQRNVLAQNYTQQGQNAMGQSGQLTGLLGQTQAGFTPVGPALGSLGATLSQLFSGGGGGPGDWQGNPGGNAAGLAAILGMMR